MGQLHLAKTTNDSNYIIVDEGNNIFVSSGKADKIPFCFDHVIPQSSSQEDIYDHVKSVISDAYVGYNATIFSYGQTGSGKTFTMHGGGTAADRGIIPRAVESIFKNVDESRASEHVDFSMSCVEIYQEKLLDLLHAPLGPGCPETALRIRQHADGEVWVEGLTEQVVTCESDFHELFSSASKRRSTASHLMNAQSSRSHFCCIFNIRKVSIPAGQKTSSKIHLIDLAGSEMVRKTSAHGSRLVEAKYINKSLSALGNVINALTQVQSRRFSLGEGDPARSTTSATSAAKSAPHIPFRDSKLTRLLQGSLSGNAKTILVLTISSDANNLMETIATLRFGERAKKLKTAPKINTEKTELSLKKALSRAENQLLALNGTVEELRREMAVKDMQIEKLRILRAPTTKPSPPRDTAPAECARCLWLSDENERLIAALTNLENSTQLCVQSPPKPSPLYPQEIKKQMSDRLISLVTQDDPDRLTLAVADDETRCGVCGLNERETEVLNQDTGEHLGGFFTCDGNCGNSFHVRCAGEVGDGGQYVVPGGEWFCTTCSVVDDALSDVLVSAGPLSPGIVTDQSALRDYSAVVNDETKDQRIARLQAEYHAMRRERNRVLNQWQHEKRLGSKSIQYRDQREKDLDEEIIACKEIIGKLQEDISKGYSEQNRLKKLLDDMVEAQKQTQKALDAEFHPVRDLVERSRTRGGRRNRYAEDRSTASSPGPQESPTSLNDDDSAEIKPNSKPHGSTEAVGSALAAALVARSGGRHLSAAASPVIAVEDIPKPWLKKGNSAVSAARRTRRGAIDVEAAADPPSARLCTSPIRSSNAGKRPNKDSLGEIESVPPYEAPVEPLAITPLSMLDSEDDVGFAPVTRKSPINSRLKNLLKSVKEETGSFAEIRKKYKDRETERLVLKTRHKGKEMGKSASLSSSLPAIL